MATPSWTTLLLGKTRATILEEILTDLKDATKVSTVFPIDDWNPGGVVRVMLDVAFSGAFELVWSGLPAIAKGGFLRLAQGLAEADIDSWNAAPEDHWLYLLASELYNVTPKGKEFTEGSVRVTNTTGGAIAITASHVMRTTSGLRFTPISQGLGAALPLNLAAGASGFVRVRAEQSGSDYNVAQGAINQLTTTIAGVIISNEIDPGIAGQQSWILSYGSDTEAPKDLADRCQARWARVAKLQTLVSDGYRSLALDSHTDVRKVAVWSNYSHALGGFKANAVTLYLGGQNGPVGAAVAVDVLAQMLPYVGIHDVLEVQPCGQQTWTPSLTIYAREAQHLAQVQVDVLAAIQGYEEELQIGQTGLIWELLARCNVDNVANVTTPALTDFIPNKHALITIARTPGGNLTFLPMP